MRHWTLVAVGVARWLAPRGRVARCATIVAALVGVLASAGCYHRSVRYENLEVNSWGLFLDREVAAELRRDSTGAIAIGYSARDRVDPTLPATVEAAVQAAIRAAAQSALPVPTRP